MHGTHNADVVRMAIRDFGSLCFVRAENESAPRDVVMLVRQMGTGGVLKLQRHLPFLDAGSVPAGADWGYGLMLSEDAPEGMRDTTRLTITESSGETWTCEAARPVHDIDPQTRAKIVAAWRLALRGTQRMTGGPR